MSQASATFFALAALAVSPALAESISLSEPTNDTRVYQVTARVEVSGQTEFATEGKQANSRPMKSSALLSYLERRLAGAGRDAEALRSLRSYLNAESAVEVDQTRTSLRLSDDRSLIVALGGREGIAKYSPSGPLSRMEIELLLMPGDSLAALALLPRSNVEVGEKWTPEGWVAQTLANVDAVLKSELTCVLESATEDVALVKFTGSIEGAAVGASTNIALSGRFRFNRKSNHIEMYELEQKEKRSIGAVSPGLNVTAKITVERGLAPSPGPLTDEAAAKIPLEPEAADLMLHFDAVAGVRFPHDRDWHVFQNLSDKAVLRLLDKGTLIAQCNLRKIESASPGEHTSEETFQRDITKSLGMSLKNIESAEQIKTDDGRFLYRVVAVGELRSGEGEKARIVPMQWIYYLCAAPSGEQVSLLFSLEPASAERLGNRDLLIVKGLEFVKREPTKAN